MERGRKNRRKDEDDDDDDDDGGGGIPGLESTLQQSIQMRTATAKNKFSLLETETKMNEQGRNQQSPTQLTLLYKELKKQRHIETQRDRERHTDTQDDKDARQEELERA